MLGCLYSRSQDSGTHQLYVWPVMESFCLNMLGGLVYVTDQTLWLNTVWAHVSWVLFWSVKPMGCILSMEFMDVVGLLFL